MSQILSPVLYSLSFTVLHFLLKFDLSLIHFEVVNKLRVLIQNFVLLFFFPLAHRDLVATALFVGKTILYSTELLWQFCQK